MKISPLSLETNPTHEFFNHRPILKVSSKQSTPTVQLNQRFDSFGIEISSVKTLHKINIDTNKNQVFEVENWKPYNYIP